MSGCEMPTYTEWLIFTLFGSGALLGFGLASSLVIWMLLKVAKHELGDSNG